MMKRLLEMREEDIMERQLGIYIATALQKHAKEVRNLSPYDENCTTGIYASAIVNEMFAYFEKLVVLMADENETVPEELPA